MRRRLERIAVVGWVALTVFYSSAGPDPVFASESETPIVMRGVTFVSSGGTAGEVVVWADEARLDASGKRAFLKWVHLTVRPDGDGSEIEIRCLRGEIELETQALRLEGEVRGRTPEGQGFEVDWLEYDEAAGVLYSDAPVIMRDDAGWYRGGAFRYALEERRFELLSGVQVYRR